MSKKYFSVFITIMEPISNVTFGAKPLNTRKIKKYDTKRKKFVKIPATFVMLDGTNENDLKAMNYIAKKWENAIYVKKISTAANWMGKKNYIKIFALTEQMKNFDKLNPGKILGIAEIREEQEEGNVLSHIQDKPSVINVNSDTSKYKRVGRSMIKSLQKLYDQIALVSVNNENIERFYKDNDFIEYADCPGNFVWYKNIFMRLKLHIQNIYHRVGLF